MINYLFTPLELQHFTPDSKASSYFVYFIALVACCGFAVYYAFFGNSIFLSLSLLTSAFLCVAIAQLYQGSANPIGKIGFITILSGEIILASYEMGFLGLILMFPMSACYLFIFNLRTAISLSLIAIPASLFAALHVLEPGSVINYGVAQILSFSFSVAFAIALDKNQAALKRDAGLDFLTGIANRRALFAWIQEELIERKGTKDCITVFYIDIDNFKQINDSYGHAIGDEVLRKFCARILSCIRNNELVYNHSVNINFARLAGDEFILSIFNIDMPEAAEAIGRRILKQVAEPFKLENREVSINLSIGILQTDIDNADAKSLLDQADLAMYEAKSKGKNQIRFFDSCIADQMIRNKMVESGLSKAIETGSFDLKFMPIYDCKSLQLAGVEVLIRANNLELRGVGPDEFIPIAEKNGWIKEIDLLVLESTFRKLSALGVDSVLKGVFFSINISALELHNTKFPGKLAALLDKYNIPPDQIELEITETSLIIQDDETIQILHQLKSQGIRLSLDDFGTGYTAFTQLMHYPVETLKLDQTFVNEIDCDDKSKNKMVDIVLTIADIYQLDVIAEGVETVEQLNYLQALNCEYVQGYYLAKPMSWELFLQHCHEPQLSLH